MATTTKADLEQLVKRISEAGWEVRDFGVRWRITNPAGGGPLFISKRPPSNNTLKSYSDELFKRGWNEADQQAAHEASRQAKIAADRAHNEQRIKELDELMARQATEDANRAEENAERLDRLKLSARTLRGGARKDVIDLDGKFAEELLRHNRFFARRHDADPIGRTNRPFDRRYAEYLAAQMVAGEWGLTHQGMALSADGDLLDGQHRLVAVMIAAETAPDVTIQTEITYDLDPETFKLIDQGKSRGPADVLALHGIPNRFHTAAAVRLLAAYDTDQMHRYSAVRVAPHEVLARAEELGDKLQYAIRLAGALSKLTPVSGAAVGVFIAQRAYWDAPVEDFVHGVANGFNLDEGDPRAALRSWLFNIQRKRKRVYAGPPERLAVFLKAWNYWLEGRSVKEVKIRNDEEFPTPIERVKPTSA